MQDYYRKVLDAAGYIHDEPTEENVRNCFADYVDAGYWRDIDMDDIEDITIDQMCYNLLKGKGVRARGA